MKKIKILSVMSSVFLTLGVSMTHAVTLNSSWSAKRDTPGTTIVNMIPRTTATGGKTICQLSNVDIRSMSGNFVYYPPDNTTPVVTPLEFTNRNQCAIVAGSSTWGLQAVMGALSSRPTNCNALCFTTN